MTNRSGSKMQRADRHRKPIELTLAPETLARLNELAVRSKTTRSAIVDKLVQDTLPKQQ
jgi:hypothetical protein